MSIFKSTFKPFVVRQILTRQNLLQEVNRPVNFSQYVSSKAPWVRMTSLVDYEGSDALSRKYTLLGGTLYRKSGGKNPIQRAGVGGIGAAYGGDLSTTQYGITPMPGILGMTTRSLGAYGSLVEATVKFQAWDVKQLEDLSILFMRPGYKVLLEWGWSMYLNTSVNGEDYKKKITPSALNQTYNTYSIESTAYNTIDVFTNANLNQDAIYEKLQEIRHRYSANYDGLLASIKNFEYVLQPNGSYECTTVLISIGDTIDSIRMNDTLGISIGQRDVATNINPTIDTGSLDNADYSEIKSQFELLMDEYCKLSDSNPRRSNAVISAIDAAIKAKDSPYIDRYIYKYKSGFLLSADNTLLTPTQQATLGLDQALNRSEEGLGGIRTVSTGNESTVSTAPDQQQAIPGSADNSGDKRSYYYIQFAHLLHILNVFKNVFAAREQTLVDIEIPSSPDNVNKDAISNGLCQASFNSITIDPNVAVIRNSQARLFTDAQGNRGFRPEIFKTETPPVSGPSVANYNMEEYLYDNTNLGRIGNIYINIKEVISIYRQQSVSNRGYVYLGELISEVMNKAAFALGSVNDFDKFITNNKIVVIDKHYTELESDSLYNNKFKINVSGNNSIVRKHKIESKIFPSQATMIAIAAQDRENIASIQTSTYNYLNKGLKDRLFERTDTSRDDQKNDSELGVKRAKLNAILNLIQYVNNYVIVNKGMSVYYTANTTAMNGYLNTLLVELEGGTDYKAVVPISVDLTIDGISGLTIGEIFTVDKKVLPKDYYDKRVGFIVTGISNEVNTSSWLTNIKSQMCLLDQANRQILTREKAEALLKDLQGEQDRNKIESDISVRYYNILAALTVDILLEKLVVKSMEGVVEIDSTKKPLYTKAAISEFANGLIDFNYVLKDLQTSYNEIYPKLSSNEVGNYFESIKSNTNDFLVKEKDGSLYTIVDGRKTFIRPSKNILDGDYLKTGVSVNTRAILLSDDNKIYSEEYKFVNIKDKTALLKIIQNMSFYKAMVPPAQNLFQTNYNKVTSLINSGKEVPIVFDKIDVVKAVDPTTGKLVQPIPILSGYVYAFPIDTRNLIGVR